MEYHSIVGELPYLASVPQPQRSWHPRAHGIDSKNLASSESLCFGLVFRSRYTLLSSVSCFDVHVRNLSQYSQYSSPVFLDLREDPEGFEGSNYTSFSLARQIT